MNKINDKYTKKNQDKFNNDEEEKLVDNENNINDDEQLSDEPTEE